MCACGFQSRHPLAAVLSFRIWGVPFSASMQWFRKMCAMLYWVMVGSREAQSQENSDSLCPSEQKSAAQHSQSQFSSKHLPWIRAWLSRSPHSSISSAAVFSSLTFPWSRPRGVILCLSHSQGHPEWASTSPGYIASCYMLYTFCPGQLSSSLQERQDYLFAIVMQSI